MMPDVPSPTPAPATPLPPDNQSATPLATTAAPPAATPPAVTMVTSALASRRTEETSVLLGRISAKDWPTDWVVLGSCFVLAGVMLWKSGATGAIGLPLKSNPAPSIPTLFGTLLLVSLFVERVIEVFISVWEDRETSVHEQNLDYWQSRQGRLKQEVLDLIQERDGTPAPTAARLAVLDQSLQTKRNAIEEAAANADTEEKALLPFKARTQKVSTWIGLVIGLFTAAVGFRFLAQIVDISTIYDPSKHLESEQFGWFVGADVLLTGTVLAGGSKLVHQIFGVYGSFMDTTQKSLSDRSKTS